MIRWRCVWKRLLYEHFTELCRKSLSPVDSRDGRNLLKKLLPERKNYPSKNMIGSFLRFEWWPDYRDKVLKIKVRGYVRYIWKENIEPRFSDEILDEGNEIK